MMVLAEYGLRSLLIVCCLCCCFFFVMVVGACGFVGCFYTMSFCCCLDLVNFVVLFFFRFSFLFSYFYRL